MVEIFFGILFISIFSLVLSNVINNIYSVKDRNALPSLLLWDIAGICNISKIDCKIPEYIPITDSVNSRNWLKDYRYYSNTICWDSGFLCYFDEDSSIKNKQLIMDWVYKK